MRKSLSGFVGILVGAGLMLGCQSKQKKAEFTLDQAATQYAHLSAYREIQCEMHLKFAEPMKSAWVEKLFKDRSEGATGSNSRVFKAVELVTFSWRSTPYRCQIWQGRVVDRGTAVKQVLEETYKQLDTVMCLWVQSYYADSPLRGWRKGDGKPEVGEDKITLQKGEGRSIEINHGGRSVVAHFGESGQARGRFEEIGGRLYPVEVAYEKGDNLSQVSDWSYVSDSGRQIPKSFWVNLPSEPHKSRAAWQVQFENCRWN